MKVAAVQMNSQADVAENLKNATEKVRRAAEMGARLVCLPEGFAFLGREAERARHAESLAGSGPIMDCLRGVAEEQGVFVLGGGFPETSDDATRPYNTSVLLDPEGRVVQTYRKIHLFDVELDDGTAISESKGSTPGSVAAVGRVEEHVLGFSICYDVRFPAFFERQRALGATVLTVPSAFTRTTGKAHWHVLLRARAIETQCWVIAPAQAGDHPHGRRTYGHSLIVDPWGRIVAEQTEGEGVLGAEISLEEVERARRQMPIERHRRPFH